MGEEKRTEEKIPGAEITDGQMLWELLAAQQGKTFYTAKKLPFVYEIKGGEMFVDRRKKSITRATFDAALMKIRQDKEKQITGPKKLNCFGAPYVWALFKAMNLVE